MARIGGKRMRRRNNKRSRKNRRVTSAGMQDIHGIAFNAAWSCDASRDAIESIGGRVVRARGACRPPSDKGTRFYASLSSIRAVFLSPQKPTISRLLMSVINGHLRVRRDGRRVCVPIGTRRKRETGRDERVSCEWRWYSINGHYIHHATMREVLMTLQTVANSCVILQREAPRQLATTSLFSGNK